MIKEKKYKHLQNRGLPNEFVKYIDYCKKLKFEDKPDYLYCKNLFKDLFTVMNFELDYKYDWTKAPIKKEV